MIKSPFKTLRHLLLAAFTFLAIEAHAMEDGKIRIILCGDSTTIGNTPRKLTPDKPQLEQMIEQLAAIDGLPALDVINTGKGGETAKRLLESGWYDEHIAQVTGVDYIFIRLGINDWFKCGDLKKEFPVQLKEVISRMRKDHPKAVIIPSTICRFMPHENCVEVNDLIKQVAKDEGLDLFDVYIPYNQFLLDNGENSMNVRECPLDAIPGKFHAWLKPYIHTQKGRKGEPDKEVVMVNDQSLDPILGDVKSWYYNRHPNSTGYNLIAAETVKYLRPILRKSAGK